MRLTTAFLLAATTFLAGCQEAVTPPSGVDPLITWPESPFVLTGCSGFHLNIPTDETAIAERLPEGFEGNGDKRVVLQVVSCTSTAVGPAEPKPAQFLLAIVPIVARGVEGAEFFIVEASSSDPVAPGGFQAMGIPGELVEVRAPSAPGGSWEVRGNTTHYTVTIAPNAAGRTEFPDVEYRIWGGPEGAFAGFLERHDRDDHDRLPTACALLIAEGNMQGMTTSAPCEAWFSYGEGTTLREAPVTA